MHLKMLKKYPFPKYISLILKSHPFLLTLFTSVSGLMLVLSKWKLFRKFRFKIKASYTKRCVKSIAITKPYLHLSFFYLHKITPGILMLLHSVISDCELSFYN